MSLNLKRIAQAVSGASKDDEFDRLHAIVVNHKNPDDVRIQAYEQMIQLDPGPNPPGGEDALPDPVVNIDDVNRYCQSIGDDADDAFGYTPDRFEPSYPAGQRGAQAQDCTANVQAVQQTLQRFEKILQEIQADFKARPNRGDIDTLNRLKSQLDSIAEGYWAYEQSPGVGQEIQARRKAMALQRQTTFLLRKAQFAPDDQTKYPVRAEDSIAYDKANQLIAKRLQDLSVIQMNMKADLLSAAKRGDMPKGVIQTANTFAQKLTELVGIYRDYLDQ